MLQRSNKVRYCEENGNCLGLGKKDCGGCSIMIEMLEDEENDSLGDPNEDGDEEDQLEV